jgi:DNA-binding ferritin-like protein (Dps family)
MTLREIEERLHELPPEYQKVYRGMYRRMLEFRADPVTEHEAELMLDYLDRVIVTAMENRLRG